MIVLTARWFLDLDTYVRPKISKFYDTGNTRFVGNVGNSLRAQIFDCLPSLMVGIISPVIFEVGRPETRLFFTYSRIFRCLFHSHAGKGIRGIQKLKLPMTFLQHARQLVQLLRIFFLLIQAQFQFVVFVL